MKRFLWLVLTAIGLVVAASLAPPASADLVTVSDLANLQAAIDGASGPRTIEIVAGTYVLASNIVLNKPDITIQGQSVLATRIQVSGTGERFSIYAAGCTIRNLEIEKTDKVGEQNIIYVGAGNTTIQANKIHGRYVLGDGDTSRAMVVTYGMSGLLFTGNEIYDLRQPAYINGSLPSPTTGVISGNFVHGTRGWVMDGGSLVFSGNTWSGNYLDIAILAATPSSYYTDIVAVSGANNGAVIEDQRTNPAVLSVVFVDAAASGGDGTPTRPYQTISPAVTRAVARGTIRVAAGSYGGLVTLNKPLTVLGANAGIHPAVGNHPTETAGARGPETIMTSQYYAFTPAASDLTLDGFEFTGTSGRLIDTYENADRFTLRNCVFTSATGGSGTGVVQFGGGSHTDLTLEFNLFQDRGDHAFYTGGGPFDRLAVRYNTFNSANDAIFWTATPLVDGVIEANEFDGTLGGVPGTGYALMNIGQGGNIQIRNNRFHDQLYTGFQIGIIGGSVVNNTFERIHPLSGYWGSAFELWGGQYGTAVSTNVTISGNQIHFNDVPGAALPTHGVRLRAPESGSGIDGSTIHVSGNRFLNGGVRGDAFAVRHQGNASIAVDADGNYWGTMDGAQIGALMSGPVNFVPWCNYDFTDCTNGATFVCNPDEVDINLADAGANDMTTVRYLGSLSGPLYGFVLRVEVDPIHASYVGIARPVSGPFASAAIFQVVTTSPGVCEVHAALGGSTQGTLLPCDLFRMTLHGLACTSPSGTPIALTVLDLRDGNNASLTGGSTDSGLLKVDLSVPTITTASLARTAGGPTNPLPGYAKDTDTVTLTATIGDAGCSGVEASGLSADLTSLGGGAAVAPTSYNSGTGLATWVLPVNCAGANGTMTASITAVDGLGNTATLSPAGAIIVDNTRPSAPTGFAAGPGFHKVTLNWTNPVPAGDPNLTLYGVQVRRAEWNDYPAYASPAPDYPATPAAGISAADLQPAAAAFIDDFANSTADRDICYYRAFVYDAAGNYSVAGTVDHARATNYWLGDVRAVPPASPPYDGVVDVLGDITALGVTYYKSFGDPGYDAECNVGPTFGGSRVGIPLPQVSPVRVDFEDLMIFAMNYGVVAPRGDLARLATDPVTTPTLRIRIDASRKNGLVAHLLLADNQSAVKGLHAIIGYDHTKLELTELKRSDLVSRPEVVFKNVGVAAGEVVDAALLGDGMAFAGSGEVAVLTFRVRESGAQPVLLESVLRNVENSGLGAEPSLYEAAKENRPDRSSTPEAMAPTSTELLGARPNPFASSTEIRFRLAQPGDVTIRIHDVSGRLLRTLVDGARPAGEQGASWDGSTNAGLNAGPGVYFYTFRSGGREETRKIFLAK